MHAFITQWIATCRLNAGQASRLWQLSGLLAPPAQLDRRLAQALMLTAATLLGAGLVFFVAANWQAQTRGFKLLLLQAAVLAPAILACLWPRLRAACLLLALLALGALLAFVGQTYQTGADAWQLFALWALLALPWVVLARSDGLWAAWVLIAGLAIAAWSGLPMDPDWFGTRPAPTPARVALHLALWALLFVWPLLLPRLARVAPPRLHIAWPMAALLALGVWVAGGLMALVDDRQRGAPYLVHLLLVAGAFWLAWRVRPRDHVVLALALMALDVMALGWLGRGLFGDTYHGDWTGRLLVFTVVAAVVVGVSGTWLYRLQRREARS